MSKRIVGLTIVCLAVALPALSREGFGWSKKTLEIDRIKPPGINMAGRHVNVFVNSEKTRKPAEAKALRDLTEKAILDGDKEWTAVTEHSDINVSIALDRLDCERHSETKVEYESEKTKDKDGKTTYRSVPKTKEFTRVDAEIGGTWEISDAQRRVVDSGDFDRKFNEQYEFVVPADEKVLNALMLGAASKISARIVPTKVRSHMLMPKGSFEKFIPLAESGAWDKYLEGVESVAPMNDPASDAYRQYALGVGNEGLAYTQADPKKGLELLRAAAEHYRAAVAGNKEEKLFSEPLTGFLSAARSPLDRVEESIKGYEAWTSGPTPPRTASASSRSARAKVLRNQNVIDMAAAGLSDENIMLAIDGADSTEFELTPDGLIALSKAGVSKNVIAHMQKSAKK